MKAAELEKKLDGILAAEKVVKTDGSVVVYRFGGDMTFKIHNATDENCAFLSVDHVYEVKGNKYVAYGKECKYLASARLVEVSVEDINSLSVDRIQETIGIIMYARRKGALNSTEIHIKGKYLK